MVQVVLGLVMKDFTHEEQRLRLALSRPARRSTSTSSRVLGSKQNPAVDLARLKEEERRRLEWLRLGRPQGRDRPHPHRSGDGHPGQDGPAQGRRAGAVAGAPPKTSIPPATKTGGAGTGTDQAPAVEEGATTT